MDLWNVGILPQHYTASQPEDGSSMDLWNVGILPQHYTVSQPRKPRLETSSPWKPQSSQIWQYLQQYWDTQIFHRIVLFQNSHRISYFTTNTDKSQAGLKYNSPNRMKWLRDQHIFVKQDFSLGRL
jgi:hypothetical protein